jgi:sulfite exporter TauE/SafE
MTPAFATAAFVTGVLGGVHCAGMCGGVVAGLAASARGPLVARQLAFNAGRIGSYAAAGAIAGGLGSLAQLAGPVLAVQMALFALANVLMILLGLYVAGLGGFVLRLERAGSALWRRLQPLARRTFPIDSPRKALAAGALWGWVPCGLVYSVLTLALASGSAASGAAVMAAFGLGTLPTLLAAGLAAQRLLALRRIAAVRYTAAILIIALGAAGLARLPGMREAVLTAWACIT